MVRIAFDGKCLIISAPMATNNLVLLREIPEHSSWRASDSRWIARATQRNVRYLRAVFSDAEWTDDAAALANQVAGPDPNSLMREVEAQQASVDVSSLDYEFGTEPKPHQVELFALAKGREYFAYLMEPRTGKTKPAIDECCYLYERGLIRRAVVICPKNAKGEWEEQILFHSPQRVRHEIFVYSAQKGARARVDLENWVRFSDPGCLQWLIINVDSTFRARVKEALVKFVEGFPSMVIYDESTTIKRPGTKRTGVSKLLQRRAKYRRILTGTVAPEGTTDLYSQYYFLSPDIIGARNYQEFLNRYTRPMKNNPYSLAPRNKEELASLIAPHSFRRRFRDVAQYFTEPRYIRTKVDMNPNQAKIYSDLRDEMIAEFGDRVIRVTDVLSVGLRLTQITGGWVRWSDSERPEPIPGPNPKLEALLELVESLQPEDKVVVWARFTHEIEMITAALRTVYGDVSAEAYYGKTKEVDRERIKHDFQNSDHPLRFFVGQVQAASMAIPLWRANFMVYFSNSFSYLHREQSEKRILIDREDKPGVMYYDLLCEDSFDVKILRALTRKEDLAKFLAGDYMTWDKVL